MTNQFTDLKNDMKKMDTFTNTPREAMEKLIAYNRNIFEESQSWSAVFVTRWADQAIENGGNPMMVFVAMKTRLGMGN